MLGLCYRLCYPRQHSLASVHRGHYTVSECLSPVSAFISASLWSHKRTDSASSSSVDVCVIFHKLKDADVGCPYTQLINKVRQNRTGPVKTIRSSESQTRTWFKRIFITQVWIRSRYWREHVCLRCHSSLQYAVLWEGKKLLSVHRTIHDSTWVIFH